MKPQAYKNVYVSSVKNGCPNYNSFTKIKKIVKYEIKHVNLTYKNV